MKKALTVVLMVLVSLGIVFTNVSYANDQGMTFYNFKTNERVVLKELPTTDNDCTQYFPQHESCFALYFSFRAQGYSPQEALILTLKEIAKIIKEQQGGRNI